MTLYPTAPDLCLAVALEGDNDQIADFSNLIDDWVSATVVRIDSCWYLRLPELVDIPGDEVPAKVETTFREILGAAAIVYGQAPDIHVSPSYEEHGDNGQRNLSVVIQGAASVSLGRFGATKERNKLAEKTRILATDDDDLSEVCRCLSGRPDWPATRRAFEILRRVFGKSDNSGLAKATGINVDELHDLYNCLSQPGHDPKRYNYPIKVREFTLTQAVRRTRSIAKMLIT